MTMAPLLGRLLLLTCGGFLLVHHTGAVIELTDQNFYDYAKDREVLLVDFFAPWCGDCKALDPDLENAATSLGTRSIDLAKVDCFGAGKGLCSTYGVKRWPTLKNFNRGQYTGDYTGGLSTAELAGYITTVENSVNPVNPVVNPYAAPFMPVAAAAVTQQCVSRCKISRITNKTPCYARCKGPKPLGRKVLPQPVINEKSCAKCRQPQIAGKFSNCTKPMINICDAVFPVSSLAEPSAPTPPTADINLSYTKAKENVNVNVNSLYAPKVNKASVNTMETSRLPGLQEPVTVANAPLNNNNNIINRVYPYNMNIYYPRAKQLLNYAHKPNTDSLMAATRDSNTRALANKTVEDEYGREYKVHHGKSTSLTHGTPNSIIHFLNGRKGIDNLMSKLRAAVSSLHTNPLIHSVSPLSFFAGRDNVSGKGSLNSNYPQIYHVNVPGDTGAKGAGNERGESDINILQMPGGLLVPFISFKDDRSSNADKVEAQPSFPADANSTLRKDIYRNDGTQLLTNRNDGTQLLTNRNDAPQLLTNRNDATQLLTIAGNNRKSNRTTDVNHHIKNEKFTSSEQLTSQLKKERTDSSLLNSVIFKTRLNETTEDDDAKSVYDLAIGQPIESKKTIGALKTGSGTTTNSSTFTIERESPHPIQRESPHPIQRESPHPIQKESPHPIQRESPHPIQRESPHPAKEEKKVNEEPVKTSMFKSTTRNERTTSLQQQSQTPPITTSLQQQSPPQRITTPKSKKEETYKNTSPPISSKNATSSHLQKDLNVSTETAQANKSPAPIGTESNKSAKKGGVHSNSTESDDDTVDLKGELHPDLQHDTSAVNQTKPNDIQTLLSGKTDGELTLSNEDEMDIFKIAEKFTGMQHQISILPTINKNKSMSSLNVENGNLTQGNFVKKTKTEKSEDTTESGQRLTSSHQTGNESKQQQQQQQQGNISQLSGKHQKNITLANISESLSTVLRNLSHISPKLTNYSSKLSAAFRKVLNVTKGQELLSPKLANILSQMTNISQRLQAEAFPKNRVLKIVHKSKRTKVVTTPNKSFKMKMLMKLMGYALSVLDVKRMNVKNVLAKNQTTINLACVGTCHDVP